MMATAAWSLQRAVHEALTGDASLTDLLGGPHVYDHVPRGQRHPYVTFAQTTERDWSTGGSEGSEHVLTLHVWSEARGRRELHRIIHAIRRALHEADLPLSGFSLVNLRHEFSETRRDPDGETLRGIVRFRGVTEAAEAGLN